MHSKIVWLFRLIFTDCRPTFSLAIVCLLLVLHMYWSKGFLYLLFLLNFNTTWPHGKFESCWKIFLYSFSFYNVIYYTKAKIFLHFLGMFTQQNNGFVDFYQWTFKSLTTLKKFLKKNWRKKISGGGWLCSPKMSGTLHASNLFTCNKRRLSSLFDRQPRVSVKKVYLLTTRWHIGKKV